MLSLAQSTRPLQPFSLRAGVSYLTDADARRSTSNTGFTIGGSYDFFQGKASERYSLDVDYNQHSGNGNKLDSWAFQLAVRAPFEQGETAGKTSFYYGAGLGFFRHRSTGSTTTTTTGGGGGGGGTQIAYPAGTTTTTTSSFSNTKTVFGGSLILGVRFQQNAYAELAYRISGKVEGVNANNLNLEVGFKF